MKRRAIIVLVAVVLAAAAFLLWPRSGADLKSLTVDEVAALIGRHDGTTFVYDNNDKERYAKSHLPGARWVEFNAVTAADLPPDKNATLIFYCAHEL